MRCLPQQKASVTLVALCFTAVIGIALTSYITLCSRSYNFSTRILHEDKARHLALVGLEEALWALNQNTWNSSGPAGANTWSTSGANRSVTLSYASLGQGTAGTLVLTIANYASTGPVWPTITSAATITLSDGRTVSKTLQATTGPAALFGNALASVNSYVSFANGGTLDSWNSDPDNNAATAPAAYSFTAGDATNYSAVIAASDDNNDFDGTNAVSLNQALVYGYVATTGKSVSFSTSGSPPGRIKGPATAAGVNVDPMRLGKSAFIPFPPVFTINTPPTSGPSYGGLLSDVLALVSALLSGPSTFDTYKINGDLVILGIPLLSPNLTIDRPMKLIVTGSLTLGGAGRITITPTGSLQIFVGNDGTLGGNGIDNQTNDPRKVALFFTNNSINSVRYTSTADFYGVIYSQTKPIDITQNGPFYGAFLSGGYVRFSGTNPAFHYDTSLRNVRLSNVTTPYVITQMSEP